MLGFQELLLIAVLALIFFGAEKIPELARAFGKGVVEFRKVQQEFHGELAKAAQNQSSSPINPAARFVPPGKIPQGVCACQTGKRAGSESTGVMEPVTCPNCQRGLLPEDKFCGSCGQLVSG